MKYNILTFRDGMKRCYYFFIDGKLFQQKWIDAETPKKVKRIRKNS